MNCCTQQTCARQGATRSEGNKQQTTTRTRAAAQHNNNKQRGEGERCAKGVSLRRWKSFQRTARICITCRFRPMPHASQVCKPVIALAVFFLSFSFFFFVALLSSLSSLFVAFHSLLLSLSLLVFVCLVVVVALTPPRHCSFFYLTLSNTTALLRC
jgi:hypothetical protein